MQLNKGSYSQKYNSESITQKLAFNTRKYLRSYFEKIQTMNNICGSLLKLVLKNKIYNIISYLAFFLKFKYQQTTIYSIDRLRKTGFI